MVATINDMVGDDDVYSKSNNSGLICCSCTYVPGLSDRHRLLGGSYHRLNVSTPVN